MSNDVGLQKLNDLLKDAEQLKNVQFDDARITQWRMTVRSLLEARFGSEHALCKEFAVLPFMEAYEENPTREHHNQLCRYCLEQGICVLSSAREVWPIQIPTPTGLPSVQFVNNNTATATSFSNASAQVEFPLTELLAMVERSQDLTQAAKEKAKEHLEDLDGELRKAQPRWGKVKAALKFILDAGKEIAIKTLAAVVAKEMAGQ